MKKLLNRFQWMALLGGLLVVTACNPFDSGGGGGSSGPQTVVVIGDSISGESNYPGVPPWPSLVRQMEPEWTMVNAGSRGERIAQGRAKVGGLLAAHHPDVLAILYGTNNAVMGTMTTFEGDLRATVRAGLDAGARVVVGTLPPMFGARRIYNGRVDALNVIIRRVASEEGAAVADIAREFDAGDAERFPDGLHPDLDGQRIIAITMRERL